MTSLIGGLVNRLGSHAYQRLHFILLSDRAVNSNMNMRICENKKCGIFYTGHRLIIGTVAYCGFACNRDNEKIKPKLDKPLK